MTIFEAAEQIAKKIASYNSVFILADNDADGFSSALLMSKALQNKGIKTTYKVSKTPFLEISHDKYKDYELILALDWGTQAISELEGLNKPYIIIDHHYTDLRSISLNNNNFIFNPWCFNISGEKDFCTGILSTLVSAEIDESMKQYSWLGLVAAHGDSQTAQSQGYQKVLSFASESKTITRTNIFYSKFENDIRRRLFSFLNPWIYYLSGSEEKINHFLETENVNNTKISEISENTLQDVQHKIYSSILEKYNTDIETSAKSNQLPYPERYIINSLKMTIEDCFDLINYFLKDGRGDELWYILLGLDEVDEFDMENINIFRKQLVYTTRKIRDSLKINSNFWICTVKSDDIFPKIGLGLISTIISRFDPPTIDGKIDNSRGLLLVKEFSDRWVFTSRCSKKLVLKGINLSDILSSLKSYGGSGGGHPPAAGGLLFKKSNSFDDIIEHFNFRFDILLNQTSEKTF